MGLQDYHANMLIQLRDLMAIFESSLAAGKFFTVVECWDPIISSRIDYDETHCGIFFVGDELINPGPQNDVYDYTLAFVAVFPWPSGTEFSAQIYKARLVGELKKYIAVTVNNEIIQTHGMVRVSSTDESAETTVFQDRAVVLGKDYGAIILTVLVKDALEQIT